MKIFEKMRYMAMAMAMATLSLTVSACGDDDDNGGITAPQGAITLSADKFDFTSAGGDVVLTVKAPSEWDAVTDASWIKLSKSGQLSREGKVDISVENNSSREERTGRITVKSGRTSATVTVTQAGRTPAPANPNMVVPEGYELVWSDEFDGNSLNTSDWTYEVQSPGWVNNELQHYVKGTYDGRNVTEVADGVLSINCFKAADGKICSGRIYAHVGTGWKYGIFEASIRLPKGKGTWPAFWMMPVNNDWNTTPWPLCGEIDIMEEVGYHPDYTSSSIHCDAYNHVKGTQKTAERLTSGAQDDFHAYRLEWTPEYIRTYVDGKMLLNFANDGKNDMKTWPFNRAFYPILNLAWGGDWGGAQGVDESCLPATMEVDYVRVFQKK